MSIGVSSLSAEMRKIEDSCSGAAGAKAAANQCNPRTTSGYPPDLKDFLRGVSGDLTDLLADNREEEMRAQEELKRLRDTRAELLATAYAYRLNMSAMARAAGVTRETAYQLVHEVERRRTDFKFIYDPLGIIRRS